MVSKQINSLSIDYKFFANDNVKWTSAKVLLVQQLDLSLNIKFH